MDDIVRVREVENHTRVWLRASTLTVQSVEVDRAVEVQRAVVVDVNVQRLVVGWRVDETDVARLHEVVCHDNVLLVGSHLDVVRADGGLLLIRVIQTLDVRQVRNVERGDVVGGRECQVDELSVLSEIRVDGGRVAGLWSEIVEQLRDTLVAVGIELEGVDDPDLAKMDSGREGSRVGVSGNELDILDSATVRDGDGANNGSLLKVPETQGVRPGNLKTRLQDGQRDDEIGGETDVLLPVDSESVRRELLSKNVELACNVFGMLGDDVVVGVEFNQAARGCSHSRPHVCHEETPLWCSADLVGNRGE